MAHSKSARKRIRQSRVRRARNRSQSSSLRTAVKKLRSALSAGDSGQVEQLLRPTLKLVDHTCSLGVFHANKAARLKSRLSRQANRLSA